VGEEITQLGNRKFPSEENIILQKQRVAKIIFASARNKVVYWPAADHFVDVSVLYHVRMVRDSQLERRSLISYRAVFLRKVLPIRLCQLNVASITCSDMKGEFNAWGGPIKLANFDLPLQNLVSRLFYASCT